ncbi:MAG: SRPBCC family protein [Fimbriimonadaceae bacterium]|nr:SRPBCC family protein [Fimbriimonadaceae bacterium]
MATLEVLTAIAAPPSVCFDLARDMDLHTRSLKGSGEEAIAGITTGLIGMGEEVTFRGRHFGVSLTHTSRITAFDPPRHFRDEMVKGQFRTFTHDHLFETDGEGTRMIDRVNYEAPLGVLGRIVEALVLNRYLERLLRQRGEAIRQEAENR